MDLVFVSTPNFGLGEEISEKVKGYFPKLIDRIEYMESKNIPSIHFARNLTPNLEKETEPDWENEIVINEVLGPVYRFDMRFNKHACTTDSFRIDGKPKKKTPKIGGHLLLSNIPMNLREEEYLSKVCVEEILHYFKTPESHGEETCFFHKKENKYKDYCSECQDLMRNLEEPLSQEDYVFY